MEVNVDIETTPMSPEKWEESSQADREPRACLVVEL